MKYPTLPTNAEWIDFAVEKPGDGQLVVIARDERIAYRTDGATRRAYHVGTFHRYHGIDYIEREECGPTAFADIKYWLALDTAPGDRCPL